MPIHFLQITQKALKRPTLVYDQVHAHARTILARSETVDENDCLLLRKIVDLGRSNKNDGKAGLAAIEKLIKVGNTGQPLTNFYDEKQCHEIHQFSYKEQARKIWRIRKDDIRLIFYYAEDKVILLADLLAKRKATLSQAEINYIENEVKLYIDAIESGELIIISSKD